MVGTNNRYENIVFIIKGKNRNCRQKKEIRKISNTVQNSAVMKSNAYKKNSDSKRQDVAQSGKRNREGN